MSGTLRPRERGRHVGVGLGLAAAVGASVLAGLPGLAAQAGAPPAGAAPALTELAATWKAAYNAKDGAALAALYAEDGYYVSAHVEARGREAIRAYFQRGIDAGGRIDALELLASGHSGDLAYWVGTYQATNAGRKVRGRNVVVVRRTGERWLIVAHESVEADPEPAQVNGRSAPRS